MLAALSGMDWLRWRCDAAQIRPSSLGPLTDGGRPIMLRTGEASIGSRIREEPQP